MNKRQRGNAFQDWVAKWFIDNHPGCATHNQKTASTMCRVLDKKTGELKDIWISKRQDILGCIDLIVIIPKRKPLFIQATLDSGVTKRLEELQQVPWPLDFVNVHLWQKREDSTVSIKKFTGDSLEDYGRIIRRKFFRESKEEQDDA